jgi:dTMP kinase
MSGGTFITFEGPEGGGKSTQMARLAEALRGGGHRVCVTREPGGTGAFGVGVRDLLLSGIEVTPKAELFLFIADRAQHVVGIIEPALSRGEIVLCDRYIDSTYVYQGVVRRLGADRARELNSFATGGLVPDLTVLLDVPAEVGLARLPLHGAGSQATLPLGDRTEANRLDREDVAFHRAVRQAFLDLAKTESRFRVVDATRSADEVSADILAAVTDFLAKRPSP